ncbi:hypothetical protein GCM10027443_38210 [Pontibacter brevis]
MKIKLTLLTLSFYMALSGFSAAQSQEKAFPAATTSPDAPRGYMGMAEIGYLYGKTGDNEFSSSIASPTVQLFNGYRFHRMLAVGGTVGFDFYDNVLITPLALGIRGELLKGRISPIYGIDAGYGAIFLSDESDGQQNEGGWMFSSSAGIRVKTGNGTAFTFDVGYKRQRARTETNWWGTRTDRKINYNRLSLRMGFSF